MLLLIRAVIGGNMDFEAFEAAMADLDEDAVLEFANQAAAMGEEAANQAMDACQKGMETVGERFEEGEYFVGDLVFAGEVMSEVVDILAPVFAAKKEGASGSRIVLCTVKGDLHDIGKNIVRALMQAAGFEVIDLGIDTPAEKVVEAVKERGSRIVALSGVLTLAVDSMKGVVDALKEAGLRDDVKVIIGGNPVSADACTLVGADEWAHSPAKTIETCKAWAV